MEIFINIIIILFILLVVAIIGLKIYESIKLNGLRETIIDLIVKAENAFEYGMNNEKFNAVFEGIYNKFPEIIKKFISIDNIKIFIQIVFDEIKTALDNEPKNK